MKWLAKTFSSLLNPCLQLKLLRQLRYWLVLAVVCISTTLALKVAKSWLWTQRGTRGEEQAVLPPPPMALLEQAIERIQLYRIEHQGATATALIGWDTGGELQCLPIPSQTPLPQIMSATPTLLSISAQENSSLGPLSVALQCGSYQVSRLLTPQPQLYQDEQWKQVLKEKKYRPPYLTYLGTDRLWEDHGAEPTVPEANGSSPLQPLLNRKKYVFHIMSREGTLNKVLLSPLQQEETDRTETASSAPDTTAPSTIVWNKNQWILHTTGCRPPAPTLCLLQVDPKTEQASIILSDSMNRQKMAKKWAPHAAHHPESDNLPHALHLNNWVFAGADSLQEVSLFYQQQLVTQWNGWWGFFESGWQHLS